MRESCIDCVRKHIAQATVLLIESHMGYCVHRWLAIGHLAEAEAESILMYPELANRIREERKKYENDSSYKSDLIILINMACDIAKKEGLEEEEKNV